MKPLLAITVLLLLRWIAWLLWAWYRRWHVTEIRLQRLHRQLRLQRQPPAAQRREHGQPTLRQIGA